MDTQGALSCDVKMFDVFSNRPRNSLILIVCFFCIIDPITLFGTIFASRNFESSRRNGDALYNLYPIKITLTVNLNITRSLCHI